MKVLLITGIGLDPYVTQLANSLSSYADVTVFGRTPRYLRSTITFDSSKSFQRIIEQKRRNLGVALEYLMCIFDVFHIARLSMTTRLKIVHLQGHFPFFFLIAFVPRRNRTFFWTIHDIELRKSSQGSRGILELFLAKVTNQPVILGLLAKGIIVHGNDLQRKLSESWWARGKIYSMPHGNYDGIYHSLGGLPGRQKRVLFFGKIKPYKGLELFIQGAAITSRQVPSVRFVIAGMGDLAPYKRLIQKVGPDLFDIRNGYIQDEDIPALFREASVVVIPYTEASQSGVIALAYTLGVPVVASKVGSIPEIVDHGKTGYVFEPGNVLEMSRYVSILLTDDRKREDFSRNARKKASEALSWDTIAEELMALYEGLGSKGDSPSPKSVSPSF
jgi:alpha-maltose-1-phosphate synthase